MPIYFTCSDPKYTVYMGKDKFENEELLKYGFPEDIWFHVDKFSSAHVYLRLPPGSMDMMGCKDKDAAKLKLKEALDSVPAAVVNEMCQLTKANSIDGCKMAEVDVVYTPFLNLRKEERMDTGQVGFKDEAFRILMKHVEKDKVMIKTIEKTRNEKLLGKVNLSEEKDQRDTEERARKKKAISQEKERQKEETRQQEEEKALRSYASLQNMDAETVINKSGTLDECREIEDDFM